MRRAIAIALILGVACPLLYGCSSETNPTGIADVTDDLDADKKNPWIYDPPTGFDQFLYGLYQRFNEVEWEHTNFIMYADGSTVLIEVPGQEPLEAVFEVDPMYAAMASASAPANGWLCSVSVPKKPVGGGTLFIPGNCIIFKTTGFPDEVYGSPLLFVPIQEFYPTEGFTGSFTAYDLFINEYGYPDATNVRQVVAPEWPSGTETITIVVTEIIPTDDPGPATAGVLDPGGQGDDEDPDPND